MSKHTPGPWRRAHVHPDPRCTSSIAYIEGGARCSPLEIASLFGCCCDDEQSANADLIAAAPDMYAKLRDVAGECARCNGSGYLQGEVGFSEVCADCFDIREVLAKAEGRS